MLNGNVTDDNSSTPPPSGSEGSTAASRPVRAVVANAAAISVAQQDMNHSGGGGTTSGPKNRGRQKKASESPVLPPPIVPGSVAGRKKFGKGPAISSSAALDLLHKATMDSIHSKFHPQIYRSIDLYGSIVQLSKILTLRLRFVVCCCKLNNTQ